MLTSFIVPFSGADPLNFDFGFDADEAGGEGADAANTSFGFLDGDDGDQGAAGGGGAGGGEPFDFPF